MSGSALSKSDGQGARVSEGGSLTVVVLTLNEERKIGACLSAVPKDIPVVIVDSGSSDATVEIARRMGASVAHRAWTGFADQRNFALAAPEVTTDWVLFVDADELYEPEFFAWVRGVISRNDDVDVYQVPSRLILDGRPLNHAPGYPIYHPRLVRRETAKFVPNHAGHGEAVGQCRIAYAPLGYDHHFQEGEMMPWLAKHLRLAAAEASSKEKAVTARGKMAALVGKGVFRVLARFMYHFVLKAGFLDGRAGLKYTFMYMWYDLTIYLLRNVPRGA